MKKKYFYIKYTKFLWYTEFWMKAWVEFFVSDEVRLINWKMWMDKIVTETPKLFVRLMLLSFKLHLLCNIKTRKNNILSSHQNLQKVQQFNTLL